MKCSECNSEMSIWGKDIFIYSTGQQLRDVPYWHCPKCDKEFPYLDGQEVEK